MPPFLKMSAGVLQAMVSQATLRTPPCLRAQSAPHMQHAGSSSTTNAGQVRRLAAAAAAA
jgi:hypothetical protein